jgi:hypothetical protein
MIMLLVQVMVVMLQDMMMDDDDDDYASGSVCAWCRFMHRPQSLSLSCEWNIQG